MTDELQTIEGESQTPDAGGQVSETQQQQATTENQEGAEPSPQTGTAPGEQQPAESEPQEAKQKNSFQKRINELTRMRHEAEAKAQAYQQQLEQQQREQQQNQHQSQRPRPEDFDYDDDRFNAALDQWIADGQKAEQERQTLQQQHTQAQQQQLRLQMQLQEQVAKGAEKYPDFMAVVNNPEVPGIAQVNPAAYHALIESPHFADIAYFLAKNPAEVYAFQNLTPVQAAMQVARLETKAQAQAPAPAASQAPPPPSTVGGKSEATKNPETMSMDEYAAWRNKQ